MQNCTAKNGETTQPRHRPNETELSHRWRERAVLRIPVLKLSCVNFLAGQRLPAALGYVCVLVASFIRHTPLVFDALNDEPLNVFISAVGANVIPRVHLRRTKNSDSIDRRTWAKAREMCGADCEQRAEVRLRQQIIFPVERRIAGTKGNGRGTDRSEET